MGDGLPGSRQRETLRRGSPSPYPSGCVPRTPRNLGSHCAREASPQRQRCSPWSPIHWGDPSAAVLRPRVAMARPITFFPHLCLPCPIYMPRIRGYGSSSPPKVPKTESFPKLPWIRNKAPKLKNLLPVFHFAVFVCFPHLCTNPSRKGEKGGTGSSAAPQARCGCVGPAAPPAQFCAAPWREKWALSVPVRSPALGITGFCRD